MRARRLTEQTWALIFEAGDGLLAFAREERIGAASFTAIGAFAEGVIGYFDWDRKEYLELPVAEQVEVLALTGDVAIGPEGDVAVHAHVVLGRRDGSVLGGHLFSGRVRPTLEVVVTESPAHLQRKSDPETGLALLTL